MIFVYFWLFMAGWRVGAGDYFIAFLEFYIASLLYREQR